MKRRIVTIFTVVVATMLAVATLFPDEGMWLFTQFGKLPIAEMRSHGLELTPEQIYSPTAPSLKDAVVLLGGGSASFVSAEGLMITNHHVAFGAIQSVSSVQEDYLKNGFLAKTHAEEISVPSYAARIVASIKDVTAEVLASVSDTMSPEARTRAIQAATAKIAETAKGTSDMEYSVAENYYGVQYILYGYDVLRDVRLAYAPPQSIGNYGGEVDNWFWPRHTGDFSFMRAYVGPDGKPARYAKENVPYKPKYVLPISTKGFTEDNFAMIMGFPGRTFRYRTATEISLAKDETLPLIVDIYKTRMDIIDAAGAKDRAVQIKYASKWRGLANTYKNYQGTLEGMRRADILRQRTELERQFTAFLASKPELQQRYGTVVGDISTAYNDLKSFNRKQTLLTQLRSASELLGMAERFRDYAQSFKKDSTGELRPNATKKTQLHDVIGGAYKDLEPALDQQLLAALMLKAAALPREQQIASVMNIVGTREGDQRQRRVEDFVGDLYRHTALVTAEGALKLLEKSNDDILDDPFVQLATEVDKDFSPVQQQTTAFNAKINRARGRLMEAWMAWKGPDIYPDANRTLRFTYGEVKPYHPRDAVSYAFNTTLGGVMEKETGEDPFIVEPKLRALWEKKDFGNYADPASHDVPVAFIANLDITGGNSGSPVLNGKGEIIGVAFDGNWEAVVGDYLFQDPLNRTISVDARYVLFVVDKFSNAQNILSELVIH
jgi:hypothetical protein